MSSKHIELQNLPRERVVEQARSRKLCCIVTRDNKDMNQFAVEAFLHSGEGVGLRYHRSAALLLWCPDTKTMVFRKQSGDEKWHFAAYGHTYYGEFSSECLQRLIMEQLGIALQVPHVLRRATRMFVASACPATDMEAIEIYYMPLLPEEQIHSCTPLLNIHPRDLRHAAMADQAEITAPLSIALDHFAKHYIC
jgi:hypothetical protein